VLVDRRPASRLVLAAHPEPAGSGYRQNSNAGAHPIAEERGRFAAGVSHNFHKILVREQPRNAPDLQFWSKPLNTNHTNKSKYTNEDKGRVFGERRQRRGYYSKSIKSTAFVEGGRANKKRIGVGPVQDGLDPYRFAAIRIAMLQASHPKAGAGQRGKVRVGIIPTRCERYGPFLRGAESLGLAHHQSWYKYTYFGDEYSGLARRKGAHGAPYLLL
jgi:hypothetical protein